MSKSSHPDKNAAELGIEPWPGSPCKFCTGNSEAFKVDENHRIVKDVDGKPVRLTSAEWCESMNACAATIDWELIYSGR